MRHWILILMLILTFPLTSVFGGEPEELVLLTWSEYMDAELVKKFEQQFQIKLKEVYYESDDDRNQKLLLTQGKGYDLVLVDGTTVLSYTQRNWIVPIDSTQVPNLKHIDEKWLKLLPQIKAYVVPYFWGTLGIAYRQDLVKHQISSWKDLFQPAPELKGKILMINDTRDTLNAGFKALGYSLNSESTDELAKVEQLLLAQKPFVKDYTYLQLGENSELISGEIWMALAYNGDALMLQELHPQIQFVVPEEGTMLWQDYLVVMRASKHKNKAWAFINFLNEPQNAAQLASTLYYASPNKSALKYIDSAMLKDPRIYPDDSTLSKSELVAELPGRVNKRWTSVFAKLRQ
ncbi:spermidine/putrescine ABC transporter substrate-binding protein [Deltaproteobacteria bacterium TL4]